MKIEKIKVGSDFSGVGAFNQSLNRLGIKYDEIFACDMDKYARQTFIYNYGEPKYYPKNVYDRKIPNESLDIYMTSPPCQAFSMAGKRLGKEDKRGILFFNSLEFIQINKPRYFIFENVKGLISHENGKTFSEWVNLLSGKSINGLPVLFPYEDSVPYHLYWKVLNAKHYNIPQNRERVFLIGIRDNQDNNFTFPKEKYLTKKLKDCLENDVDKKYFLSDKMINCFINHTAKQQEKGNGFKFECVDTNHAAKAITTRSGSRTDDNFIKVNSNPIVEYQLTGGKWDKTHEQSGRVYHKNGIAPTIHTMGGGNQEPKIIEHQRIRKLTPRECFRLMDFPDTFKWDVSDSQAYKQAGNSIAVGVLAEIINKLKL